MIANNRNKCMQTVTHNSFYSLHFILIDCHFCYEFFVCYHSCSPINLSLL